ncbi:MAG: cell wall-binding repeat-containing protein [Acidimicrobiia bacterium]|nr:cell wall-binding repeat-containing protein [Acidimicrobiia bacterium]
MLSRSASPASARPTTCSRALLGAGLAVALLTALNPPSASAQVTPAPALPEAESTEPPPYALPVPPDTRFAAVAREQVSLGVERVTYRRSDPLAHVEVARVAPSARTRLRAVAARDEVAGWRESVTSICRRTSCVVGINGDYWDPSNRPTGVFVADGELYQSPPPLHAQMSIDVNGTPSSEPLDWDVSLAMGGGQLIPVDAVNRHPVLDQLVLYTSRRGSSTDTPAGTREVILEILETGPDNAVSVRVVDQRTTGNVAIPDGHLILAGTGAADELLQTLGTEAALGNDVGTIHTEIGAAQHAIGGAPRLMKDGLYDFPYQDDRQANMGRAPRSAVGWTATGEMLLVGVDGRQPGHSLGLNYPELAQLLAHLGAVEAIAFDGGGSTTFVVEAQVVNRPSDGAPRSVANALVVGPAEVRNSRISGNNRYATAVAASQAAFPDGAPNFTIASGENFPDALAGAPAAVTGGGPILLVPRGTLPAVVAAEIRRLGATDAGILGGNAAVAPNVEAAVRALGVDTFRLAGPDRIATSVAISQLAFFGGAPVVYLATADSYPDALAAGAGAAAQGGPVLLVRGDTISAAVTAEIQRLRPQRIVIAGGTAAVSSSIESQAAAIAPVFRRSGANRYATAAAVAQSLYPSTADAVVATGGDFPDALSGAWLAGRQRLPLLLVEGNCTSEPALRAADELGVSGIQIMGGTAAVSVHVERLAACAP